MLYCDQTNSAEVLVSQMGAIKAGVAVVTFDEKDDCDALDNALSNSKARGLILSPGTEAAEGSTRLSYLQKLMPELANMRAGQELSVGRYPSLKHVV